MALNSKVGSQNQTVDGLTIFSEAVTITASADGTTVLDVGTGKIGATVIFDATALDTADGDETYEAQILGSDDDFTTTYELATCPIVGVGRETFPIDNVKLDAADGAIICNKIKIALVLAGTTPSLTYTARLGSLQEG